MIFPSGGTVIMIEGWQDAGMPRRFGYWFYTGKKNYSPIQKRAILSIVTVAFIVGAG